MKRRGLNGQTLSIFVSSHFVDRLLLWLGPTGHRHATSVWPFFCRNRQHCHRSPSPACKGTLHADGSAPLGIASSKSGVSSLEDLDWLVAVFEYAKHQQTENLENDFILCRWKRNTSEAGNQLEAMGLSQIVKVILSARRELGSFESRLETFKSVVCFASGNFDSRCCLIPANAAFEVQTGFNPYLLNLFQIWLDGKDSESSHWFGTLWSAAHLN